MCEGTIQEICSAMYDKHIPYIEEARINQLRMTSHYSQFTNTKNTLSNTCEIRKDMRRSHQALYQAMSVVMLGSIFIIPISSNIWWVRNAIFKEVAWAHIKSSGLIVTPPTFKARYVGALQVGATITIPVMKSNSVSLFFWHTISTWL